ncbi:hypothetical protein [Treponema sp.]|uniref:RipA family octameric membrane protein n=1 Tax=Treponema sp. TaxID=166 RepID=UPI00257A9231|nr:hypothetical protein [Treponema sp.]MBE6355463.1 hypothetical protein [Treponema sp.]
MKINWHRRDISKEEYECAFLNNSVKEAAYKEASDIRKFEIELFWKRAAFFWAFIVSIYTAYYHVLTKIYERKCENGTYYLHGKIPLIVLSGLGLFFCVSWLLSSRGSKHWQENWENHLMLLEDSITGPLHKTYEAGKAFSETKLTIAAGWIISICSYGLLLFEFVEFVKRLNNGVVCFFITCIFALLVFILLISYSQIVKGTTSKSGSIKFQTQILDK